MGKGAPDVQGYYKKFLDKDIHAAIPQYFSQSSVPINIKIDQHDNSITLTPNAPEGVKLVVLHNYQGEPVNPGYTGNAVLQNGQHYTIDYNTGGIKHPMVLAIDENGNMSYWVADVQIESPAEDMNFASSVLDSYWSGMNITQKTMLGGFTQLYDNEELFRQISAYSGRTLEEFLNDMAARVQSSLNLGDVTDFAKALLPERGVLPEIKRRVSRSLRYDENTKPPVLDYSFEAVSSLQTVNGNRYVELKAPAELRLNTKNVHDPDGYSVMLIGMLYECENGSNLVNNKILSPGTTEYFEIERPGRYEFRVIGINSRGKVSVRTDAIFAKED